MYKKIIVITIVLLVVLGTGGALTALADGPVQASGASPFSPDCNGAPQSGTLYPNSEVEPWVDFYRSDDQSFIVGAWQQDRWSTGGANGLVAGVSKDGGATWTQVLIPNITRCSGGNENNGGNYERASDPWVTFAPNGDLYHISLSFNDSNTTNAVLVSKSTDGGLNWGDPITLIRDTEPSPFNDKESITADPNDADYVYAIWDRLLVPPSERAKGRAPERALGYRGPTWFARTTDGGQSWEPARMIFDPGTVNQTIGNQIVVRPQGELINVMNLIYNFKNAHKVRGMNVAILRSGDQGESWSNAIIIDKLTSVGVTIPDTGEPVRTGDIIPEIAVDPTNGNLYIVWQDARFSGGAYDEVAFVMSLDGGNTWSSTIQVNKPHGFAAFTPSVRVSSDGTVGVSYYAFSSGAGLTDYYLVTCSTNCASADGWGDETPITDNSFDMTKAPVARGYFTGDYEGLATSGTEFLAFFSQPHDGDPSSVFFRRVTP